MFSGTPEQSVILLVILPLLSFLFFNVPILQFLLLIFHVPILLLYSLFYFLSYILLLDIFFTYISNAIQKGPYALHPSCSPTHPLPLFGPGVPLYWGT
jgi:hypothetical protein